jgi:hypothetical protein
MWRPLAVGEEVYSTTDKRSGVAVWSARARGVLGSQSTDGDRADFRRRSKCNGRLTFACESLARRFGEPRGATKFCGRTLQFQVRGRVTYGAGNVVRPRTNRLLVGPSKWLGERRGVDRWSAFFHFLRGFRARPDSTVTQQDVGLVATGVEN